MIANLLHLLHHAARQTQLEQHSTLQELQLAAVRLPAQVRARLVLVPQLAVMRLPALVQESALVQGRVWGQPPVLPLA